MYLHRGSIYSTSIRKKLNKRSYIETDLAGVDNVMPMVLWSN